MIECTSLISFRYMFLIEGENQVYAFDRDHNAFLVPNLKFPHRKEPRHTKDTLLDGEMIIDKVMENGARDEHSAISRLRYRQVGGEQLPTSFLLCILGDGHTYSV